MTGQAMENNIVTHATIPEGSSLEYTIRKNAVTRNPSFFRIGNGTMNKHKIQSIDLIQEVIEMTKAEQLVIETIKNLLGWDNENGEVYISLSASFTKSKSAMFLKGFSKLKKRGLVLRTKPSHYMINPNALVPRDYEAGNLLWKSKEDL